ncbi:MAG: YceI family protein [Patescibacteria group bacterium]
MKSLFIFIVAAAAVVVGAAYWTSRTTEVTGSPTPSVDVSPSPTSLKDGRYELDADSSSMAWQGQKTLIKSWIDRGTIQLKSGSTTVADGKVTKGNVVVDMTSIVTLNTGKGDGEDTEAKHLKSADFFDVTKYPTAEFKLTSLEKDDSSPDGYTVSGTLTLKGLTRAVTFPATVITDDDTLTMKASAQLDRTRWNIRYGSDRFFDNLGNEVIDDLFTVTFTAVAHLVPSPTPSSSATPKATPTK